MKVTIEVDCTPEEARRFVGLPDMTPVHEMMMEQMTEAAAKTKPYFDPEAFAKLWFPESNDAFQNFQRTMWAAATGAASRNDKETD